MRVREKENTKQDYCLVLRIDPQWINIWKSQYYIFLAIQNQAKKHISNKKQIKKEDKELVAWRITY